MERGLEKAINIVASADHNVNDKLITRDHWANKSEKKKAMRNSVYC